MAIDIGGTKMLIAEIKEDGTIVGEKRYATGRLSQWQLIDLMTEAVETYEREIGWLNGRRPAELGIGVVGISDPVHGIWYKINQEFAEELPLADMMKERTGAVCYIDNDVKSATIAEAVFGAGQGCRDFMYINVGTGLAAGMIANHKLIRGSDGYAGEIGYMDFNGGQGPYIEHIASGVGIHKRFQELLPEYPDSILQAHKTAGISGYQVFEAADEKDMLAIRLLDGIVQTVALLIGNLTCAFSPEKVILGGGLVSNGRLLEQIRASVKPHLLSHIEGGILLSSLNPAYTGLMGAAAIGFGNQKRYD